MKSIWAWIAMSLAAVPAHAKQPAFAHLVDEYVAAYASSQLSDQGLHYVKASQIARAVFKNPGSPEYVELLSYLGQQSQRAPEAITDLARMLNARWEALTLMGVEGLARREKREEFAAVAGSAPACLAVLGLLTVGTLKNPANGAKFLSLANRLTLLPTLGLATGAGVGYGMHQLEGPAYPSPSETMRIGITSDQFLVARNPAIETFGPLLASLAVSSITYDMIATGSIAVEALGFARTAAIAANEAATPAKVNPLALAGSIVAGIAVDQGLTELQDQIRFNEFKEKISEAVNLFDQAREIGSVAGMYQGAEALNTVVMQFFTHYNTVLLQMSAWFLQSIDEADDRLGSSPEAYQDQVVQIGYQMRDWIRPLARRPGYASDPDFESKTRLTLQLTHPASTAQQKTQARLQLDDLRHKLVDELRRGEIRSQGPHVLLQSIALFELAHRNYLALFTDPMNNLIRGTEMILAFAHQERPQTTRSSLSLPGGVTPEANNPAQPTDEIRDGGIL